MRLRIVALVLATVALAGCGDEFTYSRPMEGRYLLTSVDGRPLPAGVDTLYAFDNDPLVYRIVGRAIEFTSDEVARYQYAVDYVDINASQESPGRFPSCTSVPVQYRRSGTRLVLLIDLSRFETERPVPLRLDTLSVIGDKLVQNFYNDGRPVRLEYSPVGTIPSLCEAS